MKRALSVAVMALVTLFLMTPTAIAQAPAAPAAAPAADKAPAPAKKIVEVGGLYALWGHMQHGFLLGKDHPLNDADYMVQMLRGKLKIGTPTVGAIARMDAAQGWWGADNDPNFANQGTASVDADTGAVSVDNSAVYNPYAMFRNKDTNYPVHFDHAYAYVDLPDAFVPLRLQVGRQPVTVGNKLVLDQDLDAFRLGLKLGESAKVDLLWSKMSEGVNAVKNPKGLLMNDEDEWGDADLFGGIAKLSLGGLNAELFGLYYVDNSDGADWTYLPSGYGYFRSRFTPQVSQLTALGLALDGKIDIMKGLVWKLEADYLMGSDDVDNADHAGGAIDINDGDISGYNAYLDVTQKMDLGIGLDVGLVFGMGSGDDDPREGPGNVNKIQTAGFFPFTNVWEDSVMPDIGGISPQGLGSPVSRGYREFENTTAIQIKLGAGLLDSLRLDTSFTLLNSTQPIYAFDATGTPTDDNASDIGSEIDVNLTWKPTKNVVYKALFGYFTPGTGAAYLINGNDDKMEAAWELKHVFVAKF